MEDNLREELKNLLGDDVFREFISEYRRYRNSGLSDTFLMYNAGDLIRSAFIWSKTLKGFEYWSEVNDKWKGSK